MKVPPLTQELFAALFSIGEIINSGGPPHHKDAARLKILAIEPTRVRYQSLRRESASQFPYATMDQIVEGFDRIDPKAIQPSIQQVLIDGGLRKNYSTENYSYGFAREIRLRYVSLLPLVSSGETLEPVDGKGQDGPGDLALKEGRQIRVYVDKRERNAQAVRRCKEILGVTCLACGFNFGRFYGQHGDDYIHVHHLHPISQAEEEREVDPATDLRPLSMRWCIERKSSSRSKS